MSYSGQIWTPPANTSFTNLTPSNTTLLVETVGNSIGYVISSSASGDHLVGQYITAPATPYCAIFNLVCNPRDMVWNNVGATMLFGAGFYDGTKAVTMHAVSNTANAMGLDCYYWSNTTTITTQLGGNRETNGSFSTGLIEWFQVRDDGTNIYFYIATDQGPGLPVNWVELYRETRTLHLSSPSNVGWFIDADANSATNLYYLTLNSFAIYPL